MGNSASKSAKIDEIVSILGEKSDTTSERETSSTWYRYGVEITDVYDVVEILGQGHMGEVFTVRRKTTGHHTETTKEGLKRQQLEAAEEAEKSRKGSHVRLSSLGNGGGHGRRSSFGTRTTFSRKKSDDIPSTSPIRSKSPGSDKSPGMKSKVSKMKDKLKRIGHGDNDTVEADATLGKHLDRANTPESTHEPPALTAKPAKGIIKSDADAKHKSSPSHMSIELGDMNIGSDMSKLSMDRIMSIESTATGATGVTENTRKTIRGVHFQRTFAVKTILTSRVNKEQVQEMVNEIMIMRKLDHPYVLKLYEVYHVKRELVACCVGFADASMFPDTVHNCFTLLQARFG